MYEYIIKWGVETLTGVATSEASYEKGLMVEAIKVKNTIVVERFKIAEKAHEALVSLTVKIEDDLVEFQKKHNDSDKFFSKLKYEFHPIYYREYRKIRTKFDLTNDLLSGYSIALSGWINIDTFEDICNKRNETKPSSIVRLYRHWWLFLLSTLSRLLRLSTSDIRFWLTDLPYTEKAISWARENDILLLVKRFTEFNDDKHAVFYPSLETKEGISAFWKLVETQ